MKVTAKSRLQYRIEYFLFIFLLLGSIGFAGWLSNEYNFRSDWTAGNRHSLSNDSVELLNQLSSPVDLRSYQPDDTALTQAINEILQRYQNNKPDFNFELINPDIFIKRAKTDNIERYGQTIIEYQGKTERINKLTEETITNALIRLHRGNKPKILFLSQHGERNISDSSAIGYSKLADKLVNKGFDVSSVNLLQDILDKKNTILVLSTINKSLLAGEQKKILQYLNTGGNILWLQDPKSDASQQAIIDDLQIEFIDGVMVDNNEEVKRMLQLSHPAILPVLEYKLHPITEKMQYFTLFTTATGIKITTSPTSTPTQDEPTNTRQKWNYSDLLITSDTSWSEMGNFILGVEFQPGEDIAGPLSIGIAQQRLLTIDKKTIKQRAVIIGDTDFLANNNLGNGANLDFIINTLNWLSQDDSLISIAPKNAPDLQLKLSATAAAVIGLFFLLALPLFFFISGGFIWYKRSKR